MILDSDFRWFARLRRSGRVEQRSQIGDSHISQCILTRPSVVFGVFAATHTHTRSTRTNEVNVATFVSLSIHPQVIPLIRMTFWAMGFHGIVSQ